MYAVEVKNGHKYYGIPIDKKMALNGVNMNVKYGSLYGLLGPSGCGKTTLLSCIVGVRELNEGSLSVLGGTPGTKESGIPGPRVGYMPQDISLIMTFSIKEIIYYFGRIFGLNTEKLRDRYSFLMKLFELPDGDRYLGNCSGGQQRCVSFAASIVHEPELLILDEPTVGLDPLLREKMWNYIKQTTRTNNTAIIITTHYIEEARQSDCVGIMRDGKLLAENNPEIILRTLESDTLEDAFLKLCLKEDNNSKNNNYAYDNPLFESTEMDTIPDTGPDKTSSLMNGNSLASSQIMTIESNGQVENVPSKTTKFTKNPSRKRQIRALFTKNVLAIVRQPSGLLFILFFPIFQILCFWAAIGGNPKDLKVGIVSDELNDYEICRNHTLITAIPHEYECDFNKLSCRFVQHIDTDIVKKVYFDTFDEAYEEAKRGRILGFIYFASNFTESLIEVVRSRKGSDSGSVENREIKIYLDQTDHRLTFFIQMKLYRIFKEFAESLMTDCQYPVKLWNVPVNFLKPIYGDFELEFNRFTAPAIVITMIFFLSAIVTSAVFIYDRLEGLWVRSLVAGVHIEKMMLSHTIVNTLIMFLQCAEILFFTRFVYGIQNDGNDLTLIVLIILTGFSGMFLGLNISIYCDSYRAATMGLAGLFIPLMTLSGVVWPVEGMPWGLRHMAKRLPFTMPAIATRNIIYKAYPITERTVLEAYATTFAWIIVFILIALFGLKNKR